MTEALPDSIRQGIEAIRRDNGSGASALAKRAAEILVGVARQPDSGSYLETAAKALVAAQPTMAPIINLANGLLLDAGREDVITWCTRFIDGLLEAAKAIPMHALSLLADGMTVMTHSYSETVFDALVAARRAGCGLRVICTESRPVREGVALARKLGGEGIPVTLIVDAAMLSHAAAADVVMTGADSLSLRGVINKTGTALLSLAARSSGKSIYVVCGTQKFLPAGYRLPAETRKNPGEILAEPATNVEIANLYFDLTPLEELAGVITEEGIVHPAEIGKRLSGMPVAAPLLSLERD